jgi:tetratricopeptide (TPR) repeat protein
MAAVTMVPSARNRDGSSIAAGSAELPMAFRGALQRRMPLFRVIFLVASLGLFSPFGVSRAGAQASALEKGPPPPEPAASEAAPANASPKAEAPAPVWDPLHASKNIEVGTFYMKKGNYDAAIDRFLDAARLQPGLAKPYLLLGEVYEKKGEIDRSIGAYRKYLQLYRTAPDRATIQKRIEKLQGQRTQAQAGSG